MISKGKYNTRADINHRNNQLEQLEELEQVVKHMQRTKSRNDKWILEVDEEGYYGTLHLEETKQKLTDFVECEIERLKQELGVL